MPRSMTTTGPTKAAPVFTNDFLGRDQLIPGGAKVNSADVGFVADSAGRKFIAAGTAIGRTLAERDASTGFGPAADADDEVYLIAFDVTNALDLDDVELIRPNVVIKENFLPAWATLSVAIKAKLRGLYNMTRGAE